MQRLRQFQIVVNDIQKQTDKLSKKTSEVMQAVNKEGLPTERKPSASKLMNQEEVKRIDEAAYATNMAKGHLNLRLKLLSNEPEPNYSDGRCLTDRNEFRHQGSQLDSLSSD